MGRKFRINPRRRCNLLHQNNDPELKAIETERKQATIQCDRRRNLFLQILSNTSLENSNSPNYAIYGCGCIFAALIPTILIAIIPFHDVIKKPDYWYEFPLVGTLILLPTWIGSILFKSSCFINVRLLKRHRIFQKLYVMAFSVFWTLQGAAFIVWTKIANYQYPFPFNGFISTYIVTAASYLGLILQFPPKMRKVVHMKNRLQSLVVAMVCSQYLVILYLPIIKMMLLFPVNYQWMVALAFPLLREFNIWMTFQFAKRSCNGDAKSAEIVTNHSMCTSHALALSFVFGSIATIEASAVIIGIDFLINIFICLRIVYLKKKKPDDNDKIVSLFQELVINEMVEFMVPLAYLASLLFCYFGPNAELIGNVGSAYWHYTPIEDLEHTIKYVMMFFFVDLGSFIVSAVVLWKFCKINIYWAYGEIQKEFGWTFMIQLTTSLTVVR